MIALVVPVVEDLRATFEGAVVVVAVAEVAGPEMTAVKEAAIEIWNTEIATAMIEVESETVIATAETGATRATLDQDDRPSQDVAHHPEISEIETVIATYLHRLMLTALAETPATEVHRLLALPPLIQRLAYHHSVEAVATSVAAAAVVDEVTGLLIEDVAGVRRTMIEAIVTRAAVRRKDAGEIVMTVIEMTDIPIMICTGI